MAVVVDETVREFLVESHENLDQLDHEFVALEAEPGAQHRIAAIFRTIHTVKGTSGFLGFSKLEHLTHAGENLLSKVRDGVLTLNPQMTSALLALVDKVRKHLAAIEATGVEGDDDMTAIVARLNALAEGKHESLAPHPAPAAKADTPAAKADAPAAKADAPAAAAPVAVVAAPPPAVIAPVPPPAVAAVPPPVAVVPPPVAVVAPPVAAVPPPAAAAPAASPARSDASTTNELVAVGADGEPRGSTVSDTSVRVDVHLLDRLMNLVGELVLARNQILQCAPAVEDSAGFTGASQRLNLITTELQEGVMKTRMQPIGNVWNKLPRVVRDLSVACSKQVRIEMVGKETELDRTIIEAIKDPLTHIVRNAVDHGIEAPSVRVAKGKARTGTLTLRAYHEGGQVIIEVSDDGGGIDAAAIRQKAIAQGLISAERAARMTDRELHQLVFVPGFSTAAKVSNVSGRGVGMDVVKTNIEKIGGTVDLQVREGAGTTLKIKIPLTLAIVPALIVTSGGYRFAIPQVSLLELVRLDAQKAKRDIESIHGAPVYRLRGNLLPLVHLDRALAIPHSTEPSIHDDAVSIVVLQADEQQFGLIVDDVKDTEEIVVKPLGKELKSIAVFAGATVMGDGGVALILDVLGLAQHAGAASGVRERAFGGSQDSGANESNGGEEKQTLLLFRVGAEGRIAVPLSLVARLEEFTADRIEHAGGQRVVQYRGEIMPLLELRESLGFPASDVTDPRCVSVVVYSENGRSVGLVVDQILDIVDEVVAVRHRAGRWGIAGAAVIQGKVTELLDLRTVLQQPETAHHTETRAA